MNEATEVRSTWKGEHACSCGSEWYEVTAKHITNTYNINKGMSNCLVQCKLLFFILFLEQQKKDKKIALCSEGGFSFFLARQKGQNKLCYDFFFQNKN